MRRALPVLLALVALGTAACGDDGGGEGDELVGVLWVVTGFVDGEDTQEIEPPEGDGVLQFEPEGFVTGFDGCNGFGFTSGSTGSGLTYRIDDGRITYEGSALSTAVGCLDPEYETRFRAILEGPVDYTLDGDTLTITSPDGRGVVFTADGGS